MKKNYSLLALLLTLFSTLLYGQKDLSINDNFRSNYYYKINNTQAKQLYLDADITNDSSFFANPVYEQPYLSDSLPLPMGNYMDIWFDNNRLKYSYAPVTPWHIYVLNNDIDLIIQLLDNKTNLPVNVESVKLKHRSLQYDALTKAYLLKNAKKEGNLEIVDSGYKFYYTIRRGINDRHLVPLYDFKSFMFYKPLGYFTEPFFYAALTQVTIANLFKERYYQNISFRDEWRWIKSTYTSPFKKRENSYKSYFYFNKPIYREKDTVKFKAFVFTNYKGTTAQEPLLAYLYKDYKTHIYLGKASPKRAGSGYDFQFVLSDSLNLDLDKSYSIELKTLDSSYVGSSRFEYENYELKKAVFEINLADGAKQIKGKAFSVNFRAKDENGLPMPDTRASVYILTKSIDKVIPDFLFIPDTLWVHQFTIAKGEDKLLIPDSIFPEANINYTLHAVMQNSEQERTDLTEKISYNLNQNPLTIKAEADSILINQAIKNEKPLRFYAEDVFDHILFDTLVTAPFSIPVNTNAAYYYVESETDDASLKMEVIDADISANPYRKKDSLFCSVTNPRKLPFVYHLYLANKEIKRGTQQDFPFAMPATTAGMYYIILEFVWAGKTQSVRNSIPFLKHLVHLTVNQPAIITPGKETNISIKATDYLGLPVKDLSILAYGYTKKFNADAPQMLPPLNIQYTPRDDNDKYDLHLSPDDEFDDEIDDYDNSSISLNYQYWNSKMHLDTSWVYRFRYPGTGIEYTEIPAKDSITQIAPFVVEHGELKAIQYVLLDEVPVYFGFTEARVPYSFATDTAYHTLRIRTSSDLITLDSVKVKPNVKTIFSIDPTKYKGKGMLIKPLTDSLTKKERADLYSYIMKVDMPKDKTQFGYLERGQDLGQYVNLNSISNAGYDGSKTVGPVYWRYWNYCKYNDFTINFDYEPGYAYSFDKNKVKMKSAIETDLLPKYPRSQVPSINDEVLTKEALLHSYETILFNERLSRNLDNFNKSNTGTATLKLSYNETNVKKQPFNIILGQVDNFNLLKIYSGNTKDIDKIPPGKYQLLLVYGYNLYRKTPPFEVKDNGVNYYRITETTSITDSSANRINDLLNSLYSNPASNNDIEYQQLMNEYVKATYNEATYHCSGFVYDKEKEGIPGASIKIAGTVIGTVTDMDGAFEIDIPIGNSNMLEVMAMGYNNQTVKAGKQLKIIMEGSTNALNDVVVVGYGGTTTKRNFTGSASIISSYQVLSTSDITKAIEGAAPGIQVTSGSGTPGSGSSLQIRGRGNLSATTQPLIVVNGAIFSGDLSELNPNTIGSMSILKDTTANSLYGARGSNGVIIITTKEGVNLPESIKRKLKDVSPAMSEEMMVSSLRNNFHDDAFWQPDLVTDSEGNVDFKVKFPDDITNWQTYYIAADNQFHTGKSEGNIRSFKPISASLYAPRFLTIGDTAYLIGKSVNYMPDSVTAKASFSLDGKQLTNRTFKLGAYSNDTIPIVAPVADSLSIKYILTKDDGYFDGEEKSIPLHPVGVKVALGSFVALDAKDTSFTIYPTNKPDSLHINATASLIDVLLEEIEVVRNYGYLCNEQMASKILGIIYKEKLYTKLGKTPDEKDRRYAQGLINKLIKNTNNEQQWGWWDNGTTVRWISNHVRNALTAAKEMNYQVTIDFNELIKKNIFEFESDTALFDIEAVVLMAKTNQKVNYEKYITQMEKNPKSTLSQQFDLILLRQKLHLPYNPAPLKALKETDIYGNIYWTDTAKGVYENQVLTTTKALNILQNDTTIAIDKHKVVNWLLQQRDNKSWRNTYESVQIIEAIANTIPLQDKDALKPHLKLAGAVNQSIDSFPYQTVVTAGSAIQVQKTGLAPVYLSWYSNYWDTSDLNLGKNFQLRSYFETNTKEVQHLTGGEPTTMKVNVTVEKSADYVMLEIPIPAGCSYQEKNQSWTNYEIHREYFENKVSIFCQQLPKGKYTFEVQLLPRYSGTYTINPAKAELMYFPVFYGRTPVKSILIK